MVVILDCYTDEPSGFGVRPYLGTHQIHLSQALGYLGISHYYLTIDDLRYCSRGDNGDSDNTDLSIINQTKNSDNALDILHEAAVIYIIMGCFVDYTYFSSVPPKSDEVYSYLKDTKARKILFYVLGTVNGISPDYSNSKLSSIIDHVEHGNTYRFVLENALVGTRDFLNPNYQLLEEISSVEPNIVSQLRNPIIAEIETGTGCSTPFCYFCIESLRSPEVVYRTTKSIISQVSCLYRSGIRHFRLGRQPNFYHYHYQNIEEVENLLSGIRKGCPEIETLHVDNGNIIHVITEQGIEITKLLVKYCTSGNIIPLGIESFDNTVRKAIRKVGSAEQAIQAISVINDIGREKGLDGNSRLLPGINLIYGLPGQTSDTHKINIQYLQKILQKDFYTGRLFYRRMTRPTGISFTDGPELTQEYNGNFREIINSFVLPMQERVYPIGSIIRGRREVIWKNGDSYMRTLGTCPTRIVIRGKKLKSYMNYDVLITRNLDYRLLEGKLITQ
jgi:radical SAM superfamily enzyme with C-terminal helix-hairpin-helix motif